MTTGLIILWAALLAVIGLLAGNAVVIACGLLLVVTTLIFGDTDAEQGI